MPLRPFAVVAVTLVALAAGGCGASTKDNADDFSGEPKAVATTIDDLQDAGRSRDADKICGELLAQSLVTKIEQAAKETGRSTCNAAIKESLKDVDAFDLEVVKNGITVSGTTATARVKPSSGTDDDKLDTLQLVKETQRRGGKNLQVWKVAALGG